MKQYKRKVFQIFLKSTLAVASLLLSLVLLHTVYQILTDVSEDSGKSTLSQSSIDSKIEIYGTIQTVSDSSSSSDTDGSPDGTVSGKKTGDSEALDTSKHSDSSAVSDAGKNTGSSGDSDAGKNTGSSEASDAGKNTGSSGDSDSKKSKNTGKSLAGQDDTTVVFAGDVYFSDYVLANYSQSGIKGILSEPLLNELAGADITMLNNEFPYSTRGSQAPDKQFTFRIAPSYVSILKESGADLVTLANNHVLDYGTDALSDTFQTLDDAGIAYAGAGDSLERASRLMTKEANGRTFGFLAASRVFPVVSWNVENAQPGVFSAYDPSRLIAAVSEARSHCDFLCVYLHWGIERSTKPEQYQISMAHALIDAGADAVIGAHPHVLQGVEYYNGKPVFYSLGNFIFYQNIEQTAIAKLTLSADNTASWQLLPAKASNACTALISDANACKEFYQYIKGLSVNAKFTDKGKILPANQSAEKTPDAG